jgi:hypothetical protein
VAHDKKRIADPAPRDASARRNFSVNRQTGGQLERMYNSAARILSALFARAASRDGSSPVAAAKNLALARKKIARWVDIRMRR